MTDTREIPDAQGAQATHDGDASPEGTQDNRPEQAAAEASDISPPVEALIASIRAAVVRDAPQEARVAGVNACRSILMVLEAKPGQPLAATSQPARTPASPLMALLSQPGLLSRLAAMSRDQLLDVLKQVTGAMPARVQTPATAAPRFHIVEVPRGGPR